MRELTIRQVQDIIGWSYPTALDFAQRHGRQDETGKWLVPYSSVASIVDNRVNQAQQMYDRLVNETAP